MMRLTVVDGRHRCWTFIIVSAILLLAHSEAGAQQPRSAFTNSVIQIHPESQSVTLNSTVRLQCRVMVLFDQPTGTGAQVYWSKNDFGIGGSREDIREYGKSPRYPNSRYDLPYNLNEGQYDLQIINVELSDEGSYVCQVNFMQHEYLSQTAVLTVLVPSESPTLYQVADDGKGSQQEVGMTTPAVVEDGGLLVLLCIARHGKPGAVIFWFIDGVALVPEPGANDTVATFRAGFSGNLTVNVQSSSKFRRLMDATSRMSAQLSKLHHGKVVECRAENTGYDANSLRPASTKLEINYPPEVSIHVLPAKVNNEYMEHDIITVECSAHGRPDTFLWEWFVNGRQMENVAEPWYRLRLTSEMHNAVFRCVATSYTKGHAEVSVRIKFGPLFQEPSALLFTASPGEDVVMSCPVKGNPTPRIEWRREGGRELLHRGVTFRRDNLREEDFGTYICTAFVSDFPPVSKQMYIAKHRPPSIQPSSPVYAQLGRSARLRCTVNSVPLPAPGQTHWYFNGRMVRPDAQHSFEREEFLGGLILILKISHVLMTDYGKYNCTVQNGFGSAWYLIDLVYQDDVTLQFIIGAAVIIGILIVLGAILLCVCKQRGCFYKYKKGRSEGPGKPVDSHRNQQSQHSLSDFSVPGNKEFKQALRDKDNLFHPNRSTSWFANNSQCNSSHFYCGRDAEEQQRSLHNASKLSGDKNYFDALKDETMLNTAYPVVISTGYCSTVPSCQLLQPVNKGGTTVLSPIDPRLLSSSVDPVTLGIPCATQQSYLTSDYPTATLVPLNPIQIGAPQTSLFSSLDDTNMQVACGSFLDHQPTKEGASHNCFYPPEKAQSDLVLTEQPGRPGAPITNGIPVHTAYSGLAFNDPGSPQLCTNGQSPLHFLSMTGSYDKMLKFTTGTNAYVLEEQTTNI